MSVPLQDIKKVTKYALAREFERESMNDKNKLVITKHHQFPDMGYSRLKFCSYFSFSKDRYGTNSSNPYILNTKEEAEQSLILFKRTYKHHASKMRIIEVSMYYGYRYQVTQTGKLEAIKVYEHDKKNFINLDRFLKDEIKDNINEIKSHKKSIEDINNRLLTLNSELSKLNFNTDLSEVICG